MSTSRKPAVVIRAVRAPLRSRMALVATVVACRMPDTSPGATSAVRSSVSSPSSTAMAGSRGVVATLWKRRTPARRSSSTKSVKVPPISNATRIERDPLLCSLIPPSQSIDAEVCKRRHLASPALQPRAELVEARWSPRPALRQAQGKAASEFGPAVRSRVQIIRSTICLGRQAHAARAPCSSAMEEAKASRVKATSSSVWASEM